MGVCGFGRIITDEDARTISIQLAFVSADVSVRNYQPTVSIAADAGDGVCCYLGSDFRFGGRFRDDQHQEAEHVAEILCGRVRSVRI